MSSIHPSAARTTRFLIIGTDDDSIYLMTMFGLDAWMDGTIATTDTDDEG